MDDRKVKIGVSVVTLYLHMLIGKLFFGEPFLGTALQKMNDAGLDCVELLPLQWASVREFKEFPPEYAASWSARWRSVSVMQYLRRIVIKRDPHRLIKLVQELLLFGTSWSSTARERVIREQFPEAVHSAHQLDHSRKDAFELTADTLTELPLKTILELAVNGQSFTIDTYHLLENGWTEESLSKLIRLIGSLSALGAIPLVHFQLRDPRRLQAFLEGSFIPEAKILAAIGSEWCKNVPPGIEAPEKLVVIIELPPHRVLLPPRHFLKNTVVGLKEISEGIRSRLTTDQNSIQNLYK